MGENDEIIKEFLIESNENLDRLDHDLVLMERNPSKDILTKIFRSIHTIKGTCGFFGFSKLQAVTHAGENLLSLLRDSRLTLTPEITSGLLAMVDAIRQILAKIEQTGQEGEADYTVLINTLQNLQEPGASPQPPEPPAPPPDAPAPPTETQPKEPPPPPATPPKGTQNTQAMGEQAQAVDKIIEAAELHGSSSVSDTHIRVDVGLLDRLITLVGELVLSRNQVLQFTSTQENTAFLKTTQRLNMITSELQENVMRTRMQPIGKLWNKFPRVVRDLAIACGKKVHVEMEGEKTELDKTLLEAISDPLTHAVRNAVDHGIETPQERAAKGKNPEGQIFLRATHESGHVNIVITDDGSGLNIDRIKQKAFHLGLITEEQLEHISDREAINLIFLPGFSTAEKVTNLSGRGVGMDVVKNNIERIGGTIDVHTEPAKGTTLQVKIPLTLAIIPALIVRCAGERFAIPQPNLLELIRVEETHQSIENIKGVPVYRLRGNLLPLVYLDRELFKDDPDYDFNSIVRDKINIVVLQAGEHQFGLVVDSVSDSEEIVVKALGQHFKSLTIYAGATIMGDGKVSLILDVMGLALRAHVLSDTENKLLSEKRIVKEETASHDNRQSLLLFQSPDRGRIAIPLAMVARLEEIPSSSIEKAGPLDVIQYRGEILPLLHLHQILPERRKRLRNNETSAADTKNNMLQVVVYTHNNHSIGLVVDHILDIVEEKIERQSPGTREGVLGTAVILGHVTELLDLKGIILTHAPQFYGSAPDQKEKTNG